MNHGWEKKRLGEVCSILNGYAFKSSEYVTNEGIRIIRIANVQDGYISDEAPQFYPVDKVESLTKYILVENDLLMSLTGNVGRVALLPSSMLPAALNQRVACLRPNTHLKRELLFYILRNQTFVQDCIDASTGIAQLNLSTEWIKEYPVLLPSKNEQSKIVGELEKLDELIEIKRNQLKDLDTLAQSLFYETFGDPLENSKQWKVGTLSEYATFKNGLNFTPTDNGNKIKCLGVGDFKSNRFIKSENLSEINIVESISEEYLLKDGDIILVRSNGNKALIGRSIMFISDGLATTFSGFCIRCRYNREVLVPMFLSYYLSCGAVREFITSQGRGCNISNLNQKILSGIPLILPPIQLQNEFAAKVEAIERQKRLIEPSITDLETLLASRMDYWFND